MVGKYPNGTIAVLNGNAAAATTYIVPVSQNYYSSNNNFKKLTNPLSFFKYNLASVLVG
jgi:hypothetical protein